jgi:hypothetical protein
VPSRREKMVERCVEILDTTNFILTRTPYVREARVFEKLFRHGEFGAMAEDTIGGILNAFGVRSFVHDVDEKLSIELAYFFINSHIIFGGFVFNFHVGSAVDCRRRKSMVSLCKIEEDGLSSFSK